MKPDYWMNCRRSRKIWAGSYNPPSLGAKYRVIQQLFGWGAAKKATRIVAAVKLAANMRRDRLRSSAH